MFAKTDELTSIVCSLNLYNNLKGHSRRFENTFGKLSGLV